MAKYIILLCTIFTICAQTNIEFSGQIRPRFEVDQKSFSNDVATSTFTSMRTRFNVKFSKDANLEAFIQFQDSRYWGSEGSVKTDLKNIDLHQAYFIIRDILNLPIDIQIGRMELLYGSERVISIVGWNYIGNSFDGIKLKLKLNTVDLDILALQENEALLAGDNNDKYIGGIFASAKLSDNYKVEPFILWDRDIKNSISRFTPGFFINGKIDNFSHDAELIYQTGNRNNSDYDAYLFSANIYYQFNLESKPTISAGIDYLSGDDNLTDNKLKSYSSLFGSGHKFHGGMDIFTNFPLHSKDLGLNDMHIKGSVNLSKISKLTLAIHQFNSVKDAILIDKSSSKSFGKEVDLVFDYNNSKAIAFQTGFSFFIPEDIFKDKLLFNRKDNAFWGFIMATINL